MCSYRLAHPVQYATLVFAPERAPSSALHFGSAKPKGKETRELLSLRKIPLLSRLLKAIVQRVHDAWLSYRGCPKKTKKEDGKKVEEPVTSPSHVALQRLRDSPLIYQTQGLCTNESRAKGRRFSRKLNLRDETTTRKSRRINIYPRYRRQDGANIRS